MAGVSGSLETAEWQRNCNDDNDDVVDDDEGDDDQKETSAILTKKTVQNQYVPKSPMQCSIASALTNPDITASVPTKP